MPSKKGFSKEEKKSLTDRYKLATCEYCKHEFRFMLIHNGFNDTSYYYCDKCGTTALLDIYDDKYPKKIDKNGNTIYLKDIESFLLKCECSGTFKEKASPRCPHCNELIDPEKFSIFAEYNAVENWCWQKNWTGIYCIIIEDKVIRNNWK